mmetsp:Transcript_15532/g.42914  ORF Transcript_15532/g.42914 Transcript_15532/m.42914 type:complete len:215 (+) Transcript_15532:1364-2008(+)
MRFCLMMFSSIWLPVMPLVPSTFACVPIHSPRSATDRNPIPCLSHSSSIVARSETTCGARIAAVPPPSDGGMPDPMSSADTVADVGADVGPVRPITSIDSLLEASLAETVALAGIENSNISVEASASPPLLRAGSDGDGDAGDVNSPDTAPSAMPAMDAAPIVPVATLVNDGFWLGVIAEARAFEVRLAEATEAPSPRPTMPCELAATASSVRT